MQQKENLAGTAYGRKRTWQERHAAEREPGRNGMRQKKNLAGTAYGRKKTRQQDGLRKE